MHKSPHAAILSDKWTSIQ